MKPSALLLAGVRGLAAPVFAATPAPGAMHVLQTDNDRVDRIVDELQSGNSKVRADAFSELMTLKEDDLPRLKRHYADDDIAEDVRFQIKSAIIALGGSVDEPKKSGGLTIRIKSDSSASVALSGAGLKISINKEGESFVFEKDEDGAIHVEVTKGEDEEEYDYDSVEEFERENAELHRVYAEVKVRSHGEADEAEFKNDMPNGAVRGDTEALEDWLEDVRDANNDDGVRFGEGDLSDEEIAALEKKARERLERDMEDLQERERDNARERDPDDQVEEAFEIKQARYRASLRALERDLLYRMKQLRRAGGDKFEGELDDIEDSIKDTFADMHDKIDDEAPATWQQTLNTARKFHTQFGADIDKWAETIGVNPAVPNAKERVTEMKKALIERLKRLRKFGSEKYEDNLDDLEERIYSSFENLEEKVEDTPPANWGQILKDADKFHILYTSELDGWAKQMGGDESLPRPVERLTTMKRDLQDQVEDLRRIGGEDYEDVIDEIDDGINETFANLKDKLLDGEGSASILETAAKYHKQYSDIIDLWERKIVGASDKIDREFPTPESDGEVEDYPERDVDLGKGEHFDVVEGVRVARLLPLPKRQLGLDHGLAVKEIVDADRALSRAGVEVYDIILSVGDTDVDTRTDLRDAMKSIDKGAEFEVKIMRDGKEKTLKAKK